MKLGLVFAMIVGLGACGSKKDADRTDDDKPRKERRDRDRDRDRDDRDDRGDRDEQLEQARRRAEEAEAVAAKAVKEAQEARDKVDQAQKDVDELTQKLTAAVDAVMAAQNDADRTAAKAKLEQLRREKAEVETRLGEAKASAARAARLKGTSISKECMDNPLAKGCY
jgi:hypothetical protein